MTDVRHEDGDRPGNPSAPSAALEERPQVRAVPGAGESPDASPDAGRLWLHAVVLAASLFVFWFVLSGHLEPMLLGFGVASSALVAYFGVRMARVDRLVLPIHLGGRFWVYFPWLMKEILVANLRVAKIILTPGLPIDPILVRYRASQKTELGKTIYANSITLTPGTITTRVWGEELEVHSLTWVDVDGREEDEMDRRVTWVERGGRA